MDLIFPMFIGVFSFYLTLESYRKIGKIKGRADGEVDSNTTIFWVIESVFLIIGYLIATVLFAIVAGYAFLNMFG